MQAALQSPAPASWGRRFAALLCFTLSLADTSFVAAEDSGIDFFENRIRPLLIENCFECHSGSSAKSGLRLDTRDGWLKGGKRGPAIVEGDADASLLVKAVSGNDPDLRMPKDGEPLSTAQIADLRAWIKSGAPAPTMGGKYDPPLASAAKVKTHWAFQPIRKPSLPVVASGGWSRTPVDHFVLAKMEAANLSPSPEASRRTLIRRLYFDLVGIPPTFVEVERFARDAGPRAYEELVERLLASPLYGERWGRHWLDVARYSDTAGYREVGKQRRYPYSYTYRDYVIRSFNEDLPFDQFVREQLAADMLVKGGDKRALAAMGFLTLGPIFIDAIELVIDDRIDVVTRGLLGLSVQCARCHDHKYDPVPTEDYYSLYGVFASATEPKEQPLLGIEPQPALYRDYLAEQAQRRKDYEDLRAAELEKALHRIRRHSGHYLLAVHERPSLPKDKEERANWFRLRRVHPRVFPQWVKLLEKLTGKYHPILTPWMEYAGLKPAEFGARSSELAAEYRAADTSSPKLNAEIARMFAGEPPRSMRDLADRYNAVFDRCDTTWPQSDASREAIRQFLRAPESPATAPESEHDTLLQLVREPLNIARARIEALDGEHPGAPARAMALVDKPRLHDPQVFLRGNIRTRGAAVPRQFLGYFAGPDRTPFEHGSGRLELAEAIVHPENPLTARVLVNRVWMHHFGKPLVSTPSDFGTRADPPTHPGLLDWLAADFRDHGWSIKRLHRSMVNSTAYRQDSRDRPEATKRDPENHLVWKMNRRRLEFEPMRDAMLGVADRLNLTQGGLSFNVTTNKLIPRRTVYAYIDRADLPGLFRAFDFAPPDTSVPNRFETTVPQQALFMMNSPFLEQVAATIADRSHEAAANETDRIRFLFQSVLQRQPTRPEEREALAFVNRPTSPAARTEGPAWQYGVGDLDVQTGKVRDFRPFPHFTGDSWQGGQGKLDPVFKYARLTPDGGHPGPNAKMDTIRRWRAPYDGVIQIDGRLSHQSRGGDGVNGYIAPERGGIIWRGTAERSGVDSVVEGLRVSAGDHLDFVVGCRQNHNGDTFFWQPRIEYREVKSNASVNPRRIWSAFADFGGIPEKPPAPPNPWAQYAQVLLLSNEFLFVD